MTMTIDMASLQRPAAGTPARPCYRPRCWCSPTHHEWAVDERRYLPEEAMAELQQPDPNTIQEAPLAITA